MKNILFLFALSLLGSQLGAQVTVYFQPGASGSGSSAGTAGNPYGNIGEAVDAAATKAAAAGTNGEVLIPDGNYQVTRPWSIATVATAASPVTIRPENPYAVTIHFSGRSLFKLEGASRYITVEGLEIDGGASVTESEFWCIVAEDLWSASGNPGGGGLAFILDGEYLTVKNNYIHDCYQKGVEINDGRHLKIEGNIINRIALTSLSGGHGIMRQQQGNEFFTDDDDDVYRWDLNGNFIINVEQRIYSWVPSKGFMEMVIDEGKSILIDDPKDTDMVQEQMSARITHNVVAFGVVDHIRLKSTPNLEVSNNSVYGKGDNADGITDKIGDKKSNGTKSPARFVNFILKNNAVEVENKRGVFSYDGKDAKAADEGGSTVDIENNYAGNMARTNLDVPGEVKQVAGSLFTNPEGGNFTINNSEVPMGIGVSPDTLAAITARAAGFGFTVQAETWKTDNLVLTQTIFDNMPGVYDAVSGNETVLTDYGTVHFETKTDADGKVDTVEIDITASIKDGTVWKEERIDDKINNPANRPDEEKFVFGEEYMAWYLGVLRDPEVDKTLYDRIRYGKSYVKQDFTIPSDWLMHSVIEGAGENTLMEAYDNTVTLGGDLLVDFTTHTPQVGQSWDLITAGTIDAASAFANVIFRGTEPDNYTLEVVSAGSGQALRLSIVAEPLPVELTAFTATPVGEKFVRLAWTTAAEVSSEYFAVERSADGNDWREIGRLAGRGDAVGSADYELIDDAPLAGDNYYRLRPTDFDGSFTFSEVELVNISGVAAAFRAFPNPASDLVTVRGKHVTSLDLRIMDAQGRDVTARCNVRGNDRNLSVSVSGLPAGVYYFVAGGESVRVSVR